ncbi:hypothetical protein PVL29_022725 [Vitis rotundifolia]|uniref:Uncharacterized protein n=1 Tax=Vitis rotundifolia TaxID=103349 RepID=A0AA39DAI7_VITRO|nr:hypothetical protein PVL29_022725 [Vitis rotundifolia]
MGLPATFLHAVMLLENQFSSRYMIRTCLMIDRSRNLARNSRYKTNQNVTAGEETERKRENFPETSLVSQDLRA